uniref:Uncharacterized protein n=1 Tax=Corethron hystrix TaxID=216773 RepID=A0A7S1FXU5_9STRA
MANFRSDGSLFVRALLTALVVGTLLRDAESRRRSSRANYYYGHRRQPRTPWTPSRWSVSENSSAVNCFERDVSYTSAVHNVVSTYLNNAMSEWSDADFRVVRNVDDVELSYDEWLRRIVLDPSQFDWHGDGFAGSTESVKRRARRRTALVSHLIRRRGIQWGRALSCASDSVVNGAAKVRGDVRGAVATTFRRLGRHDNGPAVSALLHVENGTARPLRRVGLLRAEEREDLMARADSILRAVYAAADDQELWEDVTRDQKGAVEDLAESIQKDKYRRTNVWKTFVDMTRYDPTEKGEKGGEPQTTEVPTILSKSILDASPAEAFALFCDNDRVHEYNDNCQELVDIEDLDEMTKVNWCATGKFGPFKVRSCAHPDRTAK